MGMFVNPDNSAFQTTLNARIYVDKSGLIRYTNSVLASTDAFICNSRPRRFGKSITANMLTAYYSRGCNSEEMFSGLEISKAEDFKRHLNQYDVIHLDIQWCIEPAGGPEHVVSYISEKTIAELREYYPDVPMKETKSLPEALSQINTATGKRFVIIIDEWDVLIRDEATNELIQKEYIGFLRGLFKGTEPTKYIQLAYLTGILPIKKEKTQSALNNFDEFTMLSPGSLAQFIGFTEDEVRSLAATYHQDFDKVKRWYDGYLLKDYEVYNPRAVVSVMLNGEFKSYWSETASYEAIVPLINMDYDGLKTAVIEMLSGGIVNVNTATFKNDIVNIQSKDDVLTYMIHLGYLGYDQKKRATFVPNEEIRQELTMAVTSRHWNEMLLFWQESENLLEATLDKDGDAVARQIEKIQNQQVNVAAIEKIEAKPVPLSSKVILERSEYESLAIAAKKYITAEKKESKLQKALDAANRLIAKLKAEIVGLKQELSEYKSVRSKLRTSDLEVENAELRGKVRSYEDVIQRNNLWRFFRPRREKAAMRDDAR